MAMVTVPDEDPTGSSSTAPAGRIRAMQMRITHAPPNARRNGWLIMGSLPLCICRVPREKLVCATIHRQILLPAGLSVGRTRWYDNPDSGLAGLVIYPHLLSGPPAFSHTTEHDIFPAMACRLQGHSIRINSGGIPYFAVLVLPVFPWNCPEKTPERSVFPRIWWISLSAHKKNHGQEDRVRYNSHGPSLFRQIQ